MGIPPCALDDDDSTAIALVAADCIAGAVEAADISGAGAPVDPAAAAELGATTGVDVAVKVAMVLTGTVLLELEVEVADVAAGTTGTAEEEDARVAADDCADAAEAGAAEEAGKAEDAIADEAGAGATEEEEAIIMGAEED